MTGDNITRRESESVAAALHWLPVTFRVDIKDLRLIYKKVYGLAY